MRHLTLGNCLIGVAVAAVLLVAFGVSADTLVVSAVALACPLMMVLMMRGMAHGHGHGTGSSGGSGVDDHDRTR